MLRALSLCACCRQYPGAAAGRRLRSFTQPYQPSPKLQSGRSAHRHTEACSAFTRVAARTLAPSPICDQPHRRLQPFRHLHDCSGCFRLGRSPGWDLHPLESAAFSRRTQKARAFPRRSERVKFSTEGLLRQSPRHSAFDGAIINPRQSDTIMDVGAWLLAIDLGQYEGPVPRAKLMLKRGPARSDRRRPQSAWRAVGPPQASPQGDRGSRDWGNHKAVGPRACIVADDRRAPPDHRHVL